MAGRGRPALHNRNYTPGADAPTRSTVLYNSPLCKVGFWRATLPLASPPCSPVRGRAVGQPRSAGYAGCLTAAPCTPPSVKSKPEATAKADYRLRSTNPIPAHQPKSALDYKSALLFRKNHSSTTKKYRILARLKAEELLRRARMKRLGNKNNQLRKINSEDLANPDIPASPPFLASPSLRQWHVNSILEASL